MLKSRSFATEAWGQNLSVLGPANVCQDCEGDGYNLVKVKARRRAHTQSFSCIDVERRECVLCQGTGKRKARA